MALIDLVAPRINELGKIKIGGLGDARQSKSGGTYRMPVKLDHFVITTLQRDKAGALIPDEALMKSLAEYADHDGKLRQLPIAVLSNEIEDIMQCSYVWYEGKKCAARSDGKTLTVFYSIKDKKWLDTPEQKDWQPEWANLTDAKGNKRFKLHTTLNVVIAAKDSRWGGFYKFRSTSQISAAQLYGSLIHLRELTGGILRGIPLRLVVRPLQVSPGGKTTTVYVVHVELRGPDLTAIQNQALERARFELANKQQMQQAQIEYRKMLSAPGEHESVVDAAEIAEEFHPDDHEAAPPMEADPLAAALGIDGTTATATTTAPAPVPVAVGPVEGEITDDNFDDGDDLLDEDEGDAFEPGTAPADGKLFDDKEPGAAERR